MHYLLQTELNRLHVSLAGVEHLRKFIAVPADAIRGWSREEVFAKYGVELLGQADDAQEQGAQ